MSRFRGELYYQAATDKQLHRLAEFDVEAKSWPEACRLAMEQHWDTRLDAAGCRPVYLNCSEIEEAVPRAVALSKAGKFLVRLPKSLHAALTEQAREEGVSLNQLVSTLLAVQLKTAVRRDA